MLFPYTYVPHKIEKMQEFIDFIFFEVWCKAPIGVTFHPDLFECKPEFKEVMSKFGFSSCASERGRAFYKDVKKLYELFFSLSPEIISQFKKWYWGNNDLKKICANNFAAKLVRYSDLDTIYPEIAEHLAKFYKGLYNHHLLELKEFKNMIGEIDEHYKEFAKINKLNKCPFCGLNSLLGEYHSKREAYDHYLPKVFYPFNSINFRNLVQACHHCNSSYKGSKDTAFTPKDPCGVQARRKLFYPYSTQPYKIDLKVALQHADYTNLTPNDIFLHFGPPELTEQIETWKDVYEIEERYKVKFCSEDAKDWIVRVLDEWRWYGESNGEDGKVPNQYLLNVEHHCEKNPYVNEVFLECSFLSL